MPNYPQPKFWGPKKTKAPKVTLPPLLLYSPSSPPQPLSRVELHIHLDGSLRMSTIWELSKAKVHVKYSPIKVAFRLISVPKSHYNLTIFDSVQCTPPLSPGTLPWPSCHTVITS